MRKLWLAFAAVMVVSFMVLGWVGTRIYQEMPPIPDKVVTTDGTTLIDSGEIGEGQNVWQTMGGMEVGSVWGHGSYTAPDWTADWLHREAVFMLDRWANDEFGKPFEELDEEYQGQLSSRLTQKFHANNYDAETGFLTIDPLRAEAFESNVEHYRTVFIDGNADYAIPSGAISNDERLRKLSAFFFWTSWSAAADRPGDIASYTNNWPHEPLAGNAPTPANVLWSVVSVVVLLAGVVALVWWDSVRRRTHDAPAAPPTDPLDGLTLTPSMRAAGKYCAVVIGLFVAQVGLGALTAHYTVEGHGFFGIRLADVLPYAVTRTWHVQLALFWIATAFLAAGLFLAPAVGGREPRYQRLGVNVLFGALLLVVLGSLAGEWMAVQHKLGPDATFWFGHQGYEYVDLGRFWQIALFVGLLLWLGLMLRGLWPALRRRDDHRTLVRMFAGASVAIGLMYASGFFFSARSHLSVMEYWRWWVV
ncbi:MAG: hypothetical protein KDB27_20630, partial [Planctomycetales bacterium]|nr:hypothetical protein [Planctomycetales bacterium]